MKGPLNSPEIKLLGVLLRLLQSDSPIWHHPYTHCEVHPTYIFHTFVLTSFHSTTSTHEASLHFKTHFFNSRCFLAHRGISLHHIDGNLPTIVSGKFSSDKNFLVSWVKLFTEMFLEKNILGFANFSNHFYTQTKCLFLFHVLQVQFLA